MPADRETTEAFRHIDQMKEHEFFYDGLQADLHHMNINTLPEAYREGYCDALRELEARLARP